MGRQRQEWERNLQVHILCFKIQCARDEEAFIGFVSKSSLFSQDHPERAIEKKPQKKETKKIKPKKGDKK